MEGFLSTFPPYSVYGNPVCAPPAQGGSWGKREGRFMSPQGLNYLELCKTILSQVSPGAPPPPPPPPLKANTKECGVQVNAMVEKLVQCSLGPKTLLGCDERPPPSRSPEGRAQLGLRFLRPVSIYSPVSDRRLCLKSLSDDGCEKGGAEASEPESKPSGDSSEKDVKTAEVPRASKSSSFQVGQPVRDVTTGQDSSQLNRPLSRSCQRVGFPQGLILPVKVDH